MDRCDKRSPETGTIFLAFPDGCELWCRPVGARLPLGRRFYGQNPAWRLLAVGDFAHKTACDWRFARLALSGVMRRGNQI